MFCSAQNSGFGGEVQKVLRLIDMGKLHTGVVSQTVCGTEIGNAHVSLAAKDV